MSGLIFRQISKDAKRKRKTLIAKAHESLRKFKATLSKWRNLGPCDSYIHFGHAFLLMK